MGKTVLLIEDEANIATAVGFLLARDGWEVRTHADGTDALEVIADARPDLVILDMLLPGRSGLDILRALRAHSATHALPVLMLTARGADRALAETSGATGFMAKPFSNAQMLASVRALVAP
ncbi:MAG: response regulator transcription factor [Alkalilacustris sp.]